MFTIACLSDSVLNRAKFPTALQRRAAAEENGGGLPHWAQRKQSASASGRLARSRSTKWSCSPSRSGVVVVRDCDAQSGFERYPPIASLESLVVLCYVLHATVTCVASPWRSGPFLNGPWARTPCAFVSELGWWAPALPLLAERRHMCGQDPSSIPMTCTPKAEHASPPEGSQPRGALLFHRHLSRQVMFPLGAAGDGSVQRVA